VADLLPFCTVAFGLYDAIEGTDSVTREGALKRLMIEALKKGVVTGFFADEDSNALAQVPPWAWVGCEDEEYLWTEGVLPLNPFLPDEWWQYSFSRVVLPRDGWSSSRAGSAESIPKLPKQLIRRDPPDQAFVSLSHAVSWLAYGCSVDRTHLEWAILRGRFQGGQATINDAVARLCDAALQGDVRLDGRQAGSDIVVELPRLALHEARGFDVHTDGLLVGEGWARNEAGGLTATGPSRFNDVKVDRRQLMAACEPAKADPVPLTVSAETRCRDWLQQEMPSQDPKKTGKGWFWREAKLKFPNLSHTGFVRVWRPLSKEFGFDKTGRKSNC